MKISKLKFSSLVEVAEGELHQKAVKVQQQYLLLPNLPYLVSKPEYLP